MTGCTFGKGNLIHHDHGKNVYTFVRRADGKTVRIVTRPDAWPPDPPEREGLFGKIRAGTASEAEHHRFQELQDERALAVLTLPEGQLFEVQQSTTTLPRAARSIASIACERCGEITRESHIRRVNGLKLCIPCASALQAA